MENFRFEFLATDVIQKEKWARAEHGDVVDAVVHQIAADGIVLIHRERDLQLRPNAINAGDKNWIAHSGKICSKESAESADLPENLSGSCRMSFLHERLNSELQSIAKIDINARLRVRFFFLCHFCRGKLTASLGKATPSPTKSE